MIVSKQFIKTLPAGREEKIFVKLAMFEKHLLEVENQIRELPTGYYVRCIKNTDIYKFRLNNKDRILYTYSKQRDTGRTQIVFLQYVNHDEQVRKAHNIFMENINEVSMDIDICKEAYVDMTEDNAVDEYMIQYCENGLINMDLVPSIVVTEEKLASLAATNDEEYLYYLSQEQYDVIKSLNSRVLLTGAGGTGKTVVIHNALMYAKESNQRTLYVTYNELLLEATKKIYEKFVDENLEKCDFYTVRQLELEYLGEIEQELITHEAFVKWVKENKNKFKSLRARDAFETAVELNGILLGSTRNISNASFDEEESRDLFSLSKTYNKWLDENHFTDEIRVIGKILDKNSHGKSYDWVIVDEAQDLNEKQIHFINNLVKDSGCIIWSGDANQIVLPTLFSYSNIKSMYFNRSMNLKEFSMSRNYRSTNEIVDFINQITMERVRLIGKTNYDARQEGIRKGNKPNILNFETGDVQNLLHSIADKHYCALVVPNEEVKSSLIDKYSEAASRIFTIYEIKGLEYDMVVCYNLMSAYKDLWKEILQGNEKARASMRYYFNMIYVASSRAKDYLNIYEDSIYELEFEPYESCEKLESFNELQLGFIKTSTDSDWKVEAERLEKAGQGDKAKLIRDLKLEKKLEDINKDADDFYSEVYKCVSKEVAVTTLLDEAMNPGILYYRQRKYNEALEIFKKLFDDYPNESELLYYIANCYGYMTEGRSYSYRFFWNAIKLNPYNYKCYLDMACVLNSVGKYREALDILEMADEIFPDYGNACGIMSNVYANMGDIDKAKKLNSRSNKRHNKLHFNEHNKMWIDPKLSSKVGHEQKVQKAPRKNERYIAKLPSGIEFLKVDTSGEIKKCINEVSFKEVKYNKVNRQYAIVFDKELCSICEKNEMCIFGKTDKYGKLYVKEVIIKELSRFVNEIEHEAVPTAKEGIIDNREKCNVEKLILKLTEKYGENFDNVAISELDTQNLDLREFDNRSKILINRDRDVVFLMKNWDDCMKEIQKCRWSNENLSKFKADIIQIITAFEDIAKNAQRSITMIEFENKIGEFMSRFDNL